MEKKLEEHIKGIEGFKKDELKHAETQVRERLPSKEGRYSRVGFCRNSLLRRIVLRCTDYGKHTHRQLSTQTQRLLST